jgi:hypothetical protein
MQQMGGPRPSPRMGHALAFDNVRGRVILYGGIDASGNSNNETWEWDGGRETWTQLGPGPIPSRWGHGMAFDEAAGTVVMFGGAHRDAMLGDGELLDTWDYDPVADKWTNWTYPLPGIWPRPRKGHAMAHDPSRGLVVMYGGDVANTGPAGDLWEWSSMYHAWREVSPSLAPMTPGPRVFSSMIYMGLGQMVLLSRESPAFLRWNGNTNEWRSLSSPPPAPFPRSRTNAVAAWDGYLNELVVAGGGIAQGPATLSDTWLWKP